MPPVDTQASEPGCGFCRSRARVARARRSCQGICVVVFACSRWYDWARMSCGLPVERFRRHLLTLREEYLRELERMFGPRDGRYVRLGIREVDGGPCTWFPHGYKAKEVEIHLSRDAVKHMDCDWARWQLAHECVHLLDPGVPPTIVMEEGIAVWYQNRKSPWRPDDSDPPYAAAQTLVIPLMDFLPDALTTIRKKGIQMRHITPDMLSENCPELSERTSRALTCRFDSTPST